MIFFKDVAIFFCFFVCLFIINLFFNCLDEKQLMFFSKINELFIFAIKHQKKNNKNRKKRGKTFAPIMKSNVYCSKR